MNMQHFPCSKRRFIMISDFQNDFMILVVFSILMEYPVFTVKHIAQAFVRFLW